jgi:hypothetical protein
MRKLMLLAAALFTLTCSSAAFAQSTSSTPGTIPGTNPYIEQLLKQVQALQAEKRDLLLKQQECRMWVTRLGDQRKRVLEKISFQIQPMIYARISGIPLDTVNFPVLPTPHDINKYLEMHLQSITRTLGETVTNGLRMDLQSYVFTRNEAKKRGCI